MHTSPLSHCSTITPGALCAQALAHGLDAVVLTEHDTWRDPRDLASLRARFPALRIYMGVEIALAEGYDVVHVGNAAHLPNPAGHTMASLARTLAPHRDDCFLFVAHPFRFVDRWTTALEYILGHMDGIEMLSVNILRRAHAACNGLFVPTTWPLYQEALARYPVTPLYNSDAHHVLAVGAVASDIPTATPPDDETGLARLLKQSVAAPHQDRARLEAVLAHYAARRAAAS
ncbi:MAG: PHP domain-containing protein [Desulfovibrionaceae bacterium]